MILSPTSKSLSTSLRLLAAFLMLALAGTALAKGDPVEGKKMAGNCTSCHGDDGNASDLSKHQELNPRLAGQYADYIARALHEYKNGERGNLIMKNQIETLKLSDQDIDDLAAYFASQPGKLHDLSRLKR